MAYLGIAISLWPMIVPYKFTLWEAASSDPTQAFLPVGTLVLLPVILMYTGWSYWVFRGKCGPTLVTIEPKRRRRRMQANHPPDSGGAFA